MVVGVALCGEHAGRSAYFNLSNHTLDRLSVPSYLLRHLHYRHLQGHKKQGFLEIFLNSPYCISYCFSLPSFMRCLVNRSPSFIIKSECNKICYTCS